MDFCDKCGEEINQMEPCFQINYGFLCDKNSFQADVSYLLVHIDCLSDIEILNKILESLSKN